MWAFLEKVAEGGDPVATLHVLTLMVVAAAVVFLWKQNLALQKKLIAAHEQFAAAIRSTHESHANALGALHEKRMADATTLADRTVQYMNRLDRSMDRISAVLETLLQMTKA